MVVLLIIGVWMFVQLEDNFGVFDVCFLVDQFVWFDEVSVIDFGFLYIMLQSLSVKMSFGNVMVEMWGQRWVGCVGCLFQDFVVCGLYECEVIVCVVSGDVVIDGQDCVGDVGGLVVCQEGGCIGYVVCCVFVFEWLV